MSDPLPASLKVSTNESQLGCRIFWMLNAVGCLGISVFHHFIKKSSKTICHLEKISNFVLNCYTYL